MVVDQTLDQWRSNFGIGVDSVFVGVQAALRLMIPQGSGSIVNISSVSSLRAGLASGGYGAAKAALNQFSLCAAMEAAPHNVRINVVAPGAVETPGLNAATMKNEAVKKIITDAIPMLRAASARGGGSGDLFPCFRRRLVYHRRSVARRWRKSSAAICACFRYYQFRTTKPKIDNTKTRMWRCAWGNAFVYVFVIFKFPPR